MHKLSPLTTNLKKPTKFPKPKKNFISEGLSIHNDQISNNNLSYYEQILRKSNLKPVHNNNNNNKVYAAEKENIKMVNLIDNRLNKSSNSNNSNSDNKNKNKNKNKEVIGTTTTTAATTTNTTNTTNTTVNMSNGTSTSSLITMPSCSSRENGMYHHHHHHHHRHREHDQHRQHHHQYYKSSGSVNIGVNGNNQGKVTHILTPHNTNNPVENVKIQALLNPNPRGYDRFSPVKVKKNPKAKQVTKASCLEVKYIDKGKGESEGDGGNTDPYVRLDTQYDGLEIPYDMSFNENHFTFLNNTKVYPSQVTATTTACTTTTVTTQAQTTQASSLHNDNEYNSTINSMQEDHVNTITPPIDDLLLEINYSKACCGGHSNGGGGGIENKGAPSHGDEMLNEQYMQALAHRQVNRAKRASVNLVELMNDVYGKACFSMEKLKKSMPTDHKIILDDCSGYSPDTIASHQRLNQTLNDEYKPGHNMAKHGILGHSNSLLDHEGHESHENSKKSLSQVSNLPEVSINNMRRRKSSSCRLVQSLRMPDQEVASCGGVLTRGSREAGRGARVLGKGIEEIGGPRMLSSAQGMPMEEQKTQFNLGNRPNELMVMNPSGCMESLRPESKEKGLESKEKRLENKEKGLESKEKRLENKEKRPESKEKGPESNENRPENKEKGPESKEQGPENNEKKPKDKEKEPENKEKGLEKVIGDMRRIAQDLTMKTEMNQKDIERLQRDQQDEQFKLINLRLRYDMLMELNAKMNEDLIQRRFSLLKVKGNITKETRESLERGEGMEQGVRGRVSVELEERRGRESVELEGRRGSLEQEGGRESLEQEERRGNLDQGGRKESLEQEGRESLERGGKGRGRIREETKLAMIKEQIGREVIEKAGIGIRARPSVGLGHSINTGAGISIGEYDYDDFHHTASLSDKRIDEILARIQDLEDTVRDSQKQRSHYALMLEFIQSTNRQYRLDNEGDEDDGDSDRGSHGGRCNDVSGGDTADLCPRSATPGLCSRGDPGLYSRGDAAEVRLCGNASLWPGVNAAGLCPGGDTAGLRLGSNTCLRFCGDVASLCPRGDPVSLSLGLHNDDDDIALHNNDNNHKVYGIDSVHVPYSKSSFMNKPLGIPYSSISKQQQQQHHHHSLNLSGSFNSLNSQSKSGFPKIRGLKKVSVSFDASMV